MSRAALLRCTLALLFSVGAAHAQQGNLPTPVQKLPAYPPVACVTPDWRPEPCESRQVADEGGRWEWQCGNVNVKVTLSELEKPFNLPASTEYVVTGIEKSNNRFQYVWGKDDLYLNGRLCVLKAKPLPKKDETKPEPPTAEPVKCLKPDGTEEPCESRYTAQPLTPEQRYRAWRGEEPRQDRPPSIPQESCRQIDNCAPVDMQCHIGTQVVPCGPDYDPHYVSPTSAPEVDGLKLIKGSWIGAIVSPPAPVERQFDCLKPVNWDDESIMGWLGPLLYKLGCTWVASVDRPHNELAGYAVRQFYGRWPPSLIKPRWTDDFPGIKIFLTEPPTVVVLYNPGGEYQKHIKEWRMVAAEGSSVEIRGFCNSGCTLVTAYVPKDRLCFGERVSVQKPSLGIFPRPPLARIQLRISGG
jgi:hypothetical protein